MHFRDDTDRDGKQNKDVDGCTTYSVVEVDGRHEVPFRAYVRGSFLDAGAQRSVCHPNRSLTAILAAAPMSRMAPRVKNRSIM